MSERRQSWLINSQPIRMQRAMRYVDLNPPPPFPTQKNVDCNAKITKLTVNWKMSSLMNYSDIVLTCKCYVCILFYLDWKRGDSRMKWRGAEIKWLPSISILIHSLKKSQELNVHRWAICPEFIFLIRNVVIGL